MSSAGIQIPANGYTTEQVDALLDQLRRALLHRPSAFPVPCGAIVLPMPPTGNVSWVSSRYYVYDQDYRQCHTAGRHYTGSCAPCWVHQETRYDESGKSWIDRQKYMVDNGFGVLVEVPRP